MSSNIKIQRICQCCGREFTARTSVTKFCSLKCASKAYKAKLRNDKIEVSDKEVQLIKTKPVEILKAKEFLTVSVQPYRRLIRSSSFLAAKDRASPCSVRLFRSTSITHPCGLPH